MVGVLFALIGAAIWSGFEERPLPLIAAIVLAVLTLIGFFVISPNQSRVLVLFGHYRGTVRNDGFWWTNPFTARYSMSLRAHNFNSDKLKVNDLLGNPIEIAAVIVWRVRDTARAKFDVEKYEEFVAVQSEAALRQLASKHPYDDGQIAEVSTSLRGSADVVAHELGEMLQQRLDQAGVEVMEARLSHLAYAPEIASAMLQRQQATAIIAARQKIVEGACGMVDMALEHLEKSNRVELDNERRATLVGNLLVVLCAHENPTPVLNTGSLYN
jgi:regulator of protease activity HflC (stomatin/prohibitin superfamily)